jgi:hypothetical protein
MTKIIAIVVLLIVIVIGIALIIFKAKPIGQPIRASSTEPDSVTMIDTSRLFYSTPTICDTLAPLEGDVSGSDINDELLHEDDWLQLEFVAPDDLAYIEDELARLRQFKVAHGTENGWTKVFVRPDHPTPLSSLKIRLEELQSALMGSPRLELFIYRSFGDPRGTARRVAGGFALEVSPHFCVYGYEINGIVASLGALVYVADHGQVESIAQALETVCKIQPLILVDWRICGLVPLADNGEIRQWLRFLAE